MVAGLGAVATGHEYEQGVGCPLAPQACALGVSLSSSELQRPHLKKRGGSSGAYIRNWRRAPS